MNVTFCHGWGSKSPEEEKGEEANWEDEIALVVLSTLDKSRQYNKKKVS